MKKIYVRDLYNYLKNFENKDISIIMNGVVHTKIKILNAKIYYKTEDYAIKVSGRGREPEFKFDISAIYNVVVADNSSKIVFYLDNDINISITCNSQN